MTMSTAQAGIQRVYPHSVTLDDTSKVSLRLMNGGDTDRILNFARDVPEDDLLFLRIDITDRAAVGRWVRAADEGRSPTLIAEQNGEMIGYASLIHNETNWQRHIGEIRLQVGRRGRSKGLGRALAGEIFTIARDVGLRKIIAQMPSEQRGARATFQRLGFMPEALFQDFVIDRAGKTHDLVLMSLDLEGLSDRFD